MRDLRFALRSLAKAPVFAAAAILSLALGIGANTAIFTLVDQILLRMLPVERPHELIQFRLEGGRFGSQSGDGRHTFAHPQYLKFRDRNTVLSGLTGTRTEIIAMAAGERSEMVSVTMVAGNYFQVFGIQPHVGRLLQPSDDINRNAHPVVVLQYDYWQNRFGGKAGIVGEQIRLNGTPFTILGVARQGFEGTEAGIPTRMWVPVMMKPTITPTWDALDDERDSWFYLFGRLKPGMTREKAEASLKVLYRQMQEEELKGPLFARFPDMKKEFLKQTFSLIPAEKGQSNLRERSERPLIVLQCLVGFVLLIACANVANLLLARAAAGQREVAIRVALGATRWQVIKRFLCESLILAVAGGVAGVALSYWMARGLIRFLPYNPEYLSLSAAPDLRILLFAIAVTALTALIFGLAPAVRGSQAEPAAALKSEAGSVAGGHGHVRMRKTLVALQVSLCTLLVIGAGLFTRSLTELKRVDLGFESGSVIMFGLRPALVYETGRKLHVYREALGALQSLPGVAAVGASRQRLMTGGRWDSSITIPGATSNDRGGPWSFFNAVSPGYFDALGIPVKAGRDFNWNDWGTDKMRCLVNEALVKQYLNGANPVGRMMAQGRANTPDMEIVGVFRDAHYHQVRGEVPRQTFIALGSTKSIERLGGVTVYMRTVRDPRQVMPLIRAAMRRVDANFVVSDLRLMDEQLNRSLTNERLLSFLSGGFAILATLLAAVGLYGVLAFVVTRRTKEIGIRMAMGAAPSTAIGLVLREIAPVILAGVVAGVACGLAGGRYIESQLFGVKALDPSVFAAGVATIVSVALLAAFVPAWKASRIDPNRALRWE
ncbi:MAG TPA: ABC transporter permease [Bryobacteraceae bacterium]|nr:ABC transporter permease [Bryobacteraceae bacterium]